MQLSQISRIFVPKLIKLGLTEEQFHEAKQTVYLMTSDVDVVPLSVRIYHDFSHSFYIVNHEIWRPENKEILFSMQSVGGFLGAWHTLIKDSDYPHIEFFNAIGIVKFIQQERGKFLEEIRTDKTDVNHYLHDLNETVVDWHLDKIIASRKMAEWAEKFGWKNIKARNKENTPDSRVDRRLYMQWEIDDDEHHFRIYKDAHIFRRIYNNLHWYKVYHLLKPFLDESSMNKLIRYRNLLISEMKSNKLVGESGESVDQDEYYRNLYREKSKKIENGVEIDVGIDISSVWTEKYPKVYRGEPARVVDWTNERLLKTTDNHQPLSGKVTDKNYPLYFVVPKLGIGNESTVNFCASGIYLKHKKNCTEILVN